MNKFYSCVCVCSLLLLTVAGCGSEDRSTPFKTTAPTESHYYFFDTIVRVRIYDEHPQHDIESGVRELLEQIDGKMNRYLPGSEIDTVNRLAGIDSVQVSKETFEVVSKSMAYANEARGYFEPTIGPLVDLWGIGTEHAAVPSIEQVEQVLQIIDYRNLQLDDKQHSIKLKQPGMSIDLGAIAKGYAGDRIVNYLKQANILSAIVDLGGNIIAMGSRPDSSSWTIGIQDPTRQRGEPLGSIKVVDKTIVTSGVYERYFQADGKTYHHILDPHTGFPIDNGLLSVTIVTDLSMDADAMSTLVFSLGLQEGSRFVEAKKGTEAIFVTQDHHIYVTTGLADQFEVKNEEYQLVQE